jgi:glycolate oxidase
LIEIDALKIVSKMVDNQLIPVTDDIAAHLIIETDGNNLEVMMNEMETISELLTQYDIGEIFFADDANQKADTLETKKKSSGSSKN